MKIRKGYENIQKEVAELLGWLKATNKVEMSEYKDTVLNIVRLLTSKRFIQDIYDMRKDLNLPEQNSLDSDPDESGLMKWLEKNQKAPQSEFDNQIINLCVKHRLDPVRFGEFVWSFLYYGTSLPYRSLGNRSPIFSNEARYKSRVEFIYENGNIPKAGYIRFYKDTTPNKLKKFIDENWDELKKHQELLPNFPIPHSHHMGTFKNHLQIYLLYLQGYTDKEICDILIKSQRIDEDRIRRIISDMKRIVNESNSFDSTSLEYMDMSYTHLLLDLLFKATQEKV